jgi:pyroglutamyl-peptidase
MSVLITGFEPFGGETLNPSAQVATALHGWRAQGRPVVGAVLPCVFGTALQELRRHLRATRPELVICLGQAGGRATIAVERVAINVNDARMADNAGARPIDEPVDPRGPAAYWSSLPIKAIVAALREQGLAAEVSQSAGTFVCNHVFYGLMRNLRNKPVRGGFIHLPWAPEQAGAGQPSLPLPDATRAIQIAITTTLKNPLDVRCSEGSTH